MIQPRCIAQRIRRPLGTIAVLVATATVACKGNSPPPIDNFDQKVAAHLRAYREAKHYRPQNDDKSTLAAIRRLENGRTQQEQDLRELQAFAAQNMAEREVLTTGARSGPAAWVEKEVERARGEHRRLNEEHRERLAARLRESKKQGEILIAAIAGDGSGIDLAAIAHSATPATDPSPKTKTNRREGNAPPFVPADPPPNTRLSPSRVLIQTKTSPAATAPNSVEKFACQPWDGFARDFLEALPRTPPRSELFSSRQEPSAVLRTPTNAQARSLSRVAGLVPERIDPQVVGSTNDGWTRAQHVNSKGNVTITYSKPSWFDVTLFHTSRGAILESGWQLPFGDGSLRGEAEADHRGRGSEVKTGAGGSINGGLVTDTWGVALPNGAGFNISRRCSLGSLGAEVNAGSDGAKGMVGIFGPEAEFGFSVFGRPSETKRGVFQQRQFTFGFGGSSGIGIEGRLARKGVKLKIVAGAGPTLFAEGGFH